MFSKRTAEGALKALRAGGSLTGRALAGVVVMLALAAPPAGAQPATADLRPVESGELSAGDDPRAREMCLEGGAYVLAFQRVAAALGGVVVFEPGDEPFRVAGIEVSDRDEAGWSWVVFAIDGPDCYGLTVQGGRARVYSLRVGVDW